MKMNYIKLAFSFQILRICIEEQLLKKYYLIKHLILLKIQNMMDINADLLQWFIDFLIKSIMVVVLKLFQTSYQLINYTSQLLENLKNEKYTHL